MDENSLDRVNFCGSKLHYFFGNASINHFYINIFEPA